MVVVVVVVVGGGGGVGEVGQLARSYKPPRTNRPTDERVTCTTRCVSLASPPTHTRTCTNAYDTVLRHYRVIRAVSRTRGLQANHTAPLVTFTDTAVGLTAVDAAAADAMLPFIGYAAIRAFETTGKEANA